MNHKPRVSILIPNFNNGVQNSRDGRTDLIGNLMQSLFDTLQHETVPFEIIAYDDGSTDDSLQTLRDWSEKTWPAHGIMAGHRVVELIEAEHCGILSVTANILSRKAQGDILARLDGDTIMLTPNWVSKLCDVFDQAPPRLGVVGPKQLKPDGKIHAFGDWLLHPNGYIHIAHDMERHAVTQPMEVDHVMGCFYCCRKAVFDDLGGYDETFLRGQTIDFGLRARLQGWFTIAVPHIEYIHAHTARLDRATGADSHNGVMKSLETFEKKWGFNRLAADLDVVRQRYAGTPLLWNARWFGMGTSSPLTMRPPVMEDGQVKIETTEWVRFTRESKFKADLEWRVNLARDIVRQSTMPARLGVVGAQAGLVGHLLAMAGLPVVACDVHQANVQVAGRCIANQQYPETAKGKPQFIHQSDPHTLPFADDELDMLVLFDQLNDHPNPMGLLRESQRVLKREKLLLLVSPRPGEVKMSLRDMLERPPFTLQQILARIQVMASWGMMTDPGMIPADQPIALVLKNLKKSAKGDFRGDVQGDVRGDIGGNFGGAGGEGCVEVEAVRSLGGSR